MSHDQEPPRRPTSPLTMTIDEVMQDLQVSRRWLERQRHDPESDFPRPTRLGRSVRYLRSEIYAYLERHRVR